MFRPVKELTAGNKRQFGFWQHRYGNYEYTVNLWLVIPLIAQDRFFDVVFLYYAERKEFEFWKAGKNHLHQKT